MPRHIRPNAVSTLPEAVTLFGLPATSLPRAIRAGRLWVSKRRSRCFVRGPWLLEWVEAGEACWELRAGASF